MNSDQNPPFLSDTRLTFLLLLLIISISSIQAQPSPPPQNEYPYPRFSKSMATIIVVLFAAFFFLGFISIYIRRCSNDEGSTFRPTLSIHRRAGRSRGLDSEILETFPTFCYSEVKGLKIGKRALECAVCLNEFEDEETVRLIPKCDHVFHAECIDAWLEGHVTCPVCRSDLVPKPGESTQPESATELESTTEVVIIRVDDDLDDLNETPVLKRIQSEKLNPQPRSKSVRGPGFFKKFRSHSTGHSFVQPGENTDRFTLRLPDNVRKDMISKALLNRVGSTVSITGEGSGRKGTSMADRWVFSRAPSFLSRAFSVRSQKVDNGGASTSSTNIDEIPLNNIGPKSDDPGSKDSEYLGRPPV